MPTFLPDVTLALKRRVFFEFVDSSDFPGLDTRLSVVLSLR
jgi:hypothetical protein